MGRSKSTPSPAKKPVQLNTSTKSLLQKDSTTKSGVKRPLPDESSSEDENPEFAQNGFLKGKKGKFAPSGDDFAGNESTDASESEEVDTDNSEMNDLSEEDDEDEDESDDAEDDDEEEDESENESENDITKGPQKTKCIEAAAKPHAPVIKQQDSGIPKVTQKLDYSEKRAESNVKKSILRLLIPNPPRDLERLKKVVDEHGFPVEQLDVLHLHAALITVTDKNQDMNSLNRASVDGKPVHFLRLDGSNDAFTVLLPEATESLLITGLPKFVTMEMLLSKLPRGCQPISKVLLQSGKRNAYLNAATLTFSSKSESASAFSALSNVQFAGRVIRVTYKQNRAPAMEDNATQHFLVRVLNAPKDATAEQISSLFHGAVSINRAQNGAFFLDFPNEDTLRAATTGQKVLKENVLKVFIRGGISGNAVLLNNVHFDASESDLREAYPEALKVTLNRRPDGSFNGSAIVEFTSADSARTAIRKQVTVKGRRIYSQPAYVEVSTGKTPAESKPKKTKEVVPKPGKKTKVPPQIGSASEDEDASMEDEQELHKSQLKNSTKDQESSDAEEDEESSDAEEDEEEEDDEESDEEDDEGESETGGSEDEGIDDASDADEPPPKSLGKNNTPFKQRVGTQDQKHRGQHSGGGRGFAPGGRGFRGASPRGGFHGGRGSGFKNRGGGDRGRGKFQRGRGAKRGARG